MSIAWDWLSMTSGVIGGGIVVAVWESAKSFLKRPVLESADSARGCVVTTPYREGDSTYDSCFLRFRIMNSGRSTARAVQAHVFKISKRQHGGSLIEIDDEVFPLLWAHPLEYKKDIPPGTFFFLNTCFFVDRPAGERVSACTNLSPTKLTHFFDDPAEYVLEIIISAENHKAIRRTSKFSHDGRWNSLRRAS